MKDRSEEGVALIAVLWTLTLLSIIAAVLSLEMRSSAGIARNMAENAAAGAAADAGVQRAVLDLVNTPGAPPNARGFHTDGTVYAWRFANSKVQISVQDEASKIDLNQAPEGLLAVLFESVGIDPGQAQSLADAIADFREYRSAGLAWGPKNAPFQAVEELQQVLGMTAEIYGRMAASLTTYYIADTINPTMPDERLTRLLRRAGSNLQYFASSPGFVFSIRSEAKSSKGAVFVREVVVKLPTEGPQIQVLSWRQSTTNSRTAELSAGLALAMSQR
jgi:general secretion pathway protein K